MAARAGVAFVDVRGDWSSFDRGLATRGAALGKDAGRLGRSLGGALSRGMALGVKAGAVGVGASLAFSVKKAADFEGQLSSLGAVAETNAKQLERLRKQALKAGADTKFSALEAAQAQTELAKGGLSVSKIMKGGLRSSLALAAAGEMDLADAAEATVNAMKLFGLRGKDSMKVADAFATAANRTTADVADFALALKQGGSAAKASGLDFIETTSILEALAESGIKGSDAGTSMKAALTQLAAPTNKQKNLTEKLNLEFFDQQGNMKSMVDISGMLEDRLEGMTKKQQLQVVKTLAGTDGMRALLAVYDAGPRKMERFQRELGREGSAADVAKRKQDNLKGSLEQLGGSVETLGIQVGTLMIPAIRDGADELTEFGNKIGKIIERDDLSLGEKLQKSLEVAKVEARPWIDKLVAAVERADLPRRIADAISAATPMMAGAAAKAAPVVVGAFVKGWLASDVWGRLAIGGWLFAKMGGRPAFLKVGTQAGVATGAGMASGVAASGLKGKLSGLLRGWGPTLGIALAATLGPSLVKELQDAGVLGRGKGTAETPGGASGRAQQIADRAGPGRSGLAKASRELEEFEADFRRIANAPGKPKAWQDYYNGIADAISKVGAPIRDKIKDFQAVDARVKQMGDNVARSLRGMEKGGSKNFRDLSHSVGVSTRNMLKVGGKNSEETREQIHRQFKIAASKVQQAMDDKVVSVKTGSERLRELARKELKLYGISSGRVDVVLAKGANGEMRPHQRGGFLRGGKPSGDSIPVLAERGEYVLNREAVRKVGKGKLDALNFGMAPRFQAGGIVELLHPFNDPEGHGGGNSHLHIAAATVRQIVALGRRLQKLGWLVGEHPAFGGIQGRHAAGGYHPTGQAIDVNWPDAGAEAAKIRALLPMLGGKAGAGGLLRMFEGLKRPQIRGPLSVALEAGQGALDRMHGAASAAVERAVMPVEGVEAGVSGGGPWQAAMASIAQSRGWSLAAWRRLVQKESGGDPTARNPSSGAFGLGQFLGATGRAYAKYGALSTDPVAQIGAMARYISDRYGNPTAALAFHDRNNWYAAGGLVGRLGKTLKRVGKSPKLRKGAVGKLLDRIKGVGLPGGIAKDLKGLARDSDVFGEFADRAGSLTTQDPAGNDIPGVVGGKTQADWLADQLGALFKWRNRLIEAEAIVVKRRAALSTALAVARMNRGSIANRIRVLSKHPKRNRKLLRQLRPQLRALSGRIIPGLEGRRSALNTLRGDLLSNLEDVQGVGSPMGVLRSLPPLGGLGGRIFDTQLQLRDLNAPKPAVTDTGPSERDGLLEELLRQANQRTAVSEAQFKVFKGFPPFGGSFADGGVVPGPVGAARTIIAHGGEVVEPVGGGNAPVVVVKVAPGMEWLRQFISVEVDNKTRRDARGAARGLPGRGGGLVRG